MVRRIEVRGVDSSLSGLDVTVVVRRETEDLSFEFSSGYSCLVEDVVRRIEEREVGSSLYGSGVTTVVVRRATADLPDGLSSSDYSGL